MRPSADETRWKLNASSTIVYWWQGLSTFTDKPLLRRSISGDCGANLSIHSQDITALDFKNDYIPVYLKHIDSNARPKSKFLRIELSENWFAINSLWPFWRIKKLFVLLSKQWQLCSSPHHKHNWTAFLLLKVFSEQAPQVLKKKPHRVPAVGLFLD